jgi:hypothetical protein
MAKRKRASLKDKSSETLGSSKKGKGIDLLFGGPVDQQGAGPTSQSSPSAAGDIDLSGLDDSGSGVAPAMIENQELVDELGLPIALETPPDDLILASPEASQEDTIVASTLPSTASDLAGPQAGAEDDDLSGILEETISSVEEETLSSSFDENDLSGILEEDTASDAVVTDDLSGLAADDLSGLVEDTETVADDLSGLGFDDAAGDLSGLVEDSATVELSGLVVGEAAVDDLSALAAEDVAAESALPLTTAAPIDMSAPASAFQPGVTEPASTFPQAEAGAIFSDAAAMPTPVGPVSNIPPPSTETGAPDMAAPRSESISVDALDPSVAGTLGTLAETLGDKDFRPDAQDEFPDAELTVIEDEPNKLDEATRARILDYIGPRRDELFERIETLHSRVAQELSGNKTDVSFALDTLREANEYVLIRPYEYDEALYRVALVETMLNRKQKLSFWSYRLGFLILVYGLVFTVLCLLGYFARIDFGFLLGNEELGRVFQAVWFSGLAGGLGGSVEVFWRLYYRVSIKQDFDPQYFMYYLVKPVLGFVLGLIMYFLIAAGTAIGGGGQLPQLDSTSGFTLSILLGFIAGYRQESVFDMIYAIVNRISPDRKKGLGAKSVVPVDSDIAKQKPADSSSEAATSATVSTP